MHLMNDPNQSSRWAFVPNSIAVRPFLLQHPLSNKIIPNCCRNGYRYYISVRAPWVQHSSHRLDCSQLLMTTRENLRTLTCEALHLRLAQKYLSPVRKKGVLVERLFQQLQERVRTSALTSIPRHQQINPVTFS